MASAGELAVSLDGRFHAILRTFEVQLTPGDINVGGTSYNPCGHIEIVDQNGTTNRVRWVSESRGETFDLNPVTAFSGSLVPRNLQWDSGEPHLHFEFGGGPAASGVWRVHATNSVPVYVGPTRESFRLDSKADGPDWVVCNQVRNGKSLWFAYTPEDIARPLHTFSTNIVDEPVATSNEIEEPHVRTMHLTYRDENYRVPKGEIWKLTWDEPERGRNFSYDVRVLGLCYTSRDKGTQIHAFSANPSEEGLVDIWAGDASAEIWIPGGVEFYPHDESIEVRVDVYKEREATDQPRYEVVSDNCSAQSPALVVLHFGKPIYPYTWRYFETSEWADRGMNPVYHSLANRAGKPQPKAFDDILGNGLPDLVINEYVITGNNTATYTNMLTIISLDGTNVTETPAVPCTGEVFYFKDFDDDGCMEIVNTDSEQGFRKFDQHGLPMHKGVWKYDRQAGRYRETGTEDPDPPDTWPAYGTDTTQPD